MILLLLVSDSLFENAYGNGALFIDFRETLPGIMYAKCLSIVSALAGVSPDPLLCVSTLKITSCTM